MADVVGNIDPEYRHRWGDVEYGLCAQDKKCQVWIGPGFLADCGGNLNADRWYDNKLQLRQRYNELHSLNGLGKKAGLDMCKNMGECFGHSSGCARI